MLRIADFARLNGVSAKMLRSWDELGLFRPAWVDPSTGYRGYSPAQVPELRRIVALRDLGVPLRELAALVHGGADLRAVLARRRRDLERERRDVERRLRALDITVAMDAPGAGSRGLDVVVRPLERESVASLAVLPPFGDEHDAFYALEAVVRDARLRAGRPPGTVVGPVRPDGSAPAQVYVPVTGRPRRLDPESAIRWHDLPPATAATCIHRGAYAGLARAWSDLERWAVAAGRVPTGRRRIVYLQFGAEPELRVPPAYLVRRAADFVTELQLELA